jgi:hypothetical protein
MYMRPPRWMASCPRMDTQMAGWKIVVIGRHGESFSTGRAYENASDANMRRIPANKHEANMRRRIHAYTSRTLNIKSIPAPAKVGRHGAV